VTLNPAAVTQDVAVTDQPPPLDPTATANTTTIDPERIEELPVNSRNYLEFTLLAPGVAPSNPQSSAGTGGQSGSPLADSGFTFGGLRGRSNSISIDGLDNTDETTGAARVALSPEIVREFQIINNGLSADSGGAAGGAINVVTKTGTNDVHGDTFLFAQNETFNARDTVTTKAGAASPRFRRYQMGFSAGGPIQRDRLFFYAAAEQEHLSADDASEISRPVRDRINAALASGLAPSLPVRSIQAKVFRIGSDETEAAGKLTYLAGRHTLNSRFAFTNARLRGDAFNTQELNDISSRGSPYTKDYQLTGSDLMVLSPTSINEFRFQASTRLAATNAGDRFGPEIDIVGVARFGRPFDADTLRRENRVQLLDDLILERGPHELKAGVTVNRVGLRSEMRDGFGGRFAFLSVDDFIADRVAEWRQAFGTAATNFSVTSFGAFVQDRYRPIRNLTLNLGARYDVERLPHSFASDYRNINPRIGVAWNPSNAWFYEAALGSTTIGSLSRS
jgi:outer membrane receptor protein involved in Fe transport